MHGLEVLDGSGSANVEEVLADSAIAGSPALAATEVGKTVFDSDALANPSASSPGLGELAEALLQEFAARDSDGAAISGGRGGALGAQRASVAGSGVELDVGTEIDRLDLARRARDGSIAQVDFEVSFREPLAVARNPRLADDLASLGEHVIDDGARDVAAIAKQRGDGTLLPINIGLERGSGLLFGAIRRRDGAGDHQEGIEVDPNVALVTMEELRLALAAVTHLGVLDGHTSVGCDALTNSRSFAPRGIRLEILSANLGKGVNVFLQRRPLHLLGELVA